MVMVTNYTKANEELFNLYCFEECSDRKKELEAEITELNLKLAHHVVFKFDKIGKNHEEYYSCALLGLIKAIRSFSVDKKIKFATYAARCMENEVLMSMRKKSLDKKFQFFSMDLPVNFNDGSTSTISDVIADSRMDIEETYTDSELIASVHKKAADVLTERELVILNNFLLPKGERLTQRQMGARIGVNQSYISRIEQALVIKIRTLLKEDWGQELWKN